MTEERQTQRVDRGIVIATTQAPRKGGRPLRRKRLVLRDVDSCACPDFEHTGATCTHMLCCTICSARENVRAA
jgi:hypothetical protein